ncbi:2-hydroxyacid dehydrogenase [Duganella sp. FT135W]|uniref:2-hydroxyacid dehydrogenase n=1 Tax=Duganella flavida TaxID=2692175 RepID=A0A6L8KK91_9BURK|nr:2-hydroxyacid dehydrogenase [Duganella flavida]MYM24961.1 2-hydroxyacid dehydrogenase [Duganella flavida]
MELLLLIEMAAPFVADLQSRWPLARHTPQRVGEVRIAITNGSTGLSAQQMDALPSLQLVCCYGAGYENVDLPAAHARGIAVTHAPGVNNASVADHAMALMLSSARALPLLDRAVKQGKWLSHRAARPAIHSKRLGIVGMGNIGALIARRAEGFDMEIAYHARHARPDAAYRYVNNLPELARDSDYLILACPGGAATRHMVNKEVLEALGPQGFLINIARGSVVDTAALIEALLQKRIAGAALDVIENEPAIPADATQLDTLILTPHISGRSPEAQQAQHDALLYNIRACLEGRPLRHVLTLN